MPEPAEPAISLVVIAQDEAAAIGPCLDSATFCAERIVVDGGSRDGTAEAARARGAVVIEHPWAGYAAQRQVGFDAARGRWVLWLDADERVRPELAAEIERRLAAPDADGYRVGRRHWFLGDWLRHCGQYPGRQLRLVRRERARMRPLPVHETIEDMGMVVRDLDGDLDHLSTPSLGVRMAKIRRYSALTAQAAAAAGRLGELGWGRLLTDPVRRPLAILLRERGWRDGWRGLAFALLAGLEQAEIARQVAPLKRRSGRRPA